MSIIGRDNFQVRPDVPSDFLSKLGGLKVAMVVAHPDDETLWGGGVLARYQGFDVFCCSIPARDPERVLAFCGAMKMLGHHPFILPNFDRGPTHPLERLDLLQLDRYDVVITHNEDGEYGHAHHIQVHRHVTAIFDGHTLTFKGTVDDIQLSLSDEEGLRKINGLKQYNHCSSADGGKQKWQALLERYAISFETEFYKYIPTRRNIVALNEVTEREVRKRADYQQFDITSDRIFDIGPRMQQKLVALSGILPNCKGLRVLDIGCDFGFWSFRAALEGASVIGLDRSRQVRDLGFVDIPLLNNLTAERCRLDARFLSYEAGTSWWDFKPFDVVLCMSLYHHIFNLCRDHRPIWYWLSRITSGTLIWENPLTISDAVVNQNVDGSLHDSYNEAAIRECAELWFDITYEGPAVHETTRTIWVLRPKRVSNVSYSGEIVHGSNGATHAFSYKEGRRIRELEKIVGVTMFPGSLNIKLDTAFNWDNAYFRSRLLDVSNRSLGLQSDWIERWVRLYPLRVNGMRAWAMRFEGELYPSNFVELIADTRLRDAIVGQRIQLLV